MQRFTEGYVLKQVCQELNARDVAHALVLSYVQALRPMPVAKCLLLSYAQAPRPMPVAKRLAPGGVAVRSSVLNSSSLRRLATGALELNSSSLRA